MNIPLKVVWRDARARFTTLRILLLVISIAVWAPSPNTSHGVVPSVSAAAVQGAPPLPARDWQTGSSSLAVASHVLAASFYDLTNSATCVLTFNNKGPVALNVTPTLYNLAGQVRTLTAVSVPANGAQYVDMRTWVPVGDTQFEQGSIQLSYMGEELRLGAQVRIVRQSQSTGFDEQLIDFTAKFAGTRLEAGWWIPTTSAQMQLVLSNTSGTQTTATVTVARKGAASVTVPYTLAAHQTRLLDVQQNILAGAPLSQLGGITVTHNGQPGGVLTRGMVTMNAIGYSAPIEFIDPSMSKSSALHGAGLQIKSVSGQELQAYLVVRNIGMAATTVTGRVRYTTTNGSTNVIEMAPLTVLGSDVQSVSALSSLTAIQKDAVAVAGVEVEYNTLPGTVFAAIQSVSANGTHVYRVPLLDTQAQQSSTGGYPWLITASSSTIVYLKNVTQSPQYYTLQFNFSGGLYAPGQKQIEAGRTIAFDIKNLRDQQVPDEGGYVIPLTADKGQVQWSMDGDDNLVLIGRSEQIDVTNGLSSTYACQNCCPDGFVDIEGTPDPLIGAPGGTFQLQAVVTTQNCYGTAHQRVLDYFSRWLFPPTPFGTSNDQIAAINSTSGLVTFGQTLGSTFLSTMGKDREWIPTPAGCLLHISQFTDQTSVQVVPVTVTITRDGTPISGTQVVSIGTRVNLHVNVQPPSAQVTGINWLVPDNPIVSWYASNATPVKIPLVGSSLSTSNVSFAWYYAGNNRTVSVQVTVNGQMRPPVSAVFNVTRPSISYEVLGAGPVGTGWWQGGDGGSYNWAIYCGFNDASGPLGIYLRATGVPSGALTIWVQTVEKSNRRVLFPGGWQHILIADGPGMKPRLDVNLDTLQYGSAAVQADSPGLLVGGLAGATQAEIQPERFGAWLLYKPSIGDIPVPILKVTWGWSGNCHKQGDGWVGDSGQRMAITSVNVDDYPDWAGHTNDVGFAPE